MICIFCDEPIAPNDQTSPINGDQLIHQECFLRQVIGSVGHQNRRCSCFGGTEEDPPGLTKRQAAKAAFDLFKKFI